MTLRTIRTLKDFVSVPEDELRACLHAFRVAIERTKAVSTIPGSNGISIDGVQFNEFVWDPRNFEKVPTVAVHKTTLIEDLPLRPSTKRHLLEVNIYCIEDLSEISESELLVMRDIGRTTIEHLRELLKNTGMAFKPNPNQIGAIYERSRVSRKIAIEDRARNITDASHISELGLTPGVLRRAMQRGYLTVELLRGLSVRGYAIELGRSSAKEIINTLKMLGRPICGNPTPLDMWKHGLLEKKELDEDFSEKTPIANLAPWIGWSVAEKLERHGAATVGDAVTLARAGNLAKVNGVGAASAKKIT